MVDFPEGANMILSRRSVLFGLIAAPIVVRSGLIMPVKPVVVPHVGDLIFDRKGYIIGVYGFDSNNQRVYQEIFMPHDAKAVEVPGRWRTITEIVA